MEDFQVTDHGRRLTLLERGQARSAEEVKARLEALEERVRRLEARLPPDAPSDSVDSR